MNSFSRHAILHLSPDIHFRKKKSPQSFELFRLWEQPYFILNLL